MTWILKFTKQYKKDAKKCGEAMHTKLDFLLEVLSEDPFKTPLPFESLVGQLTGAYSRRLSFQHRLVYSVNRPEKVVRIHRCWSHYE